MIATGARRGCDFASSPREWNKTDRQDARNTAEALWVFLVTGEFGIPTVYKQNEVIRTLRRLCASYNLLNRQIRILTNTIQAMLTEDGLTLSSDKRSRLFKGKESVAEILTDHHLSEIIVEALQIHLLITIPGITPLTASAFLADIGDVHRYPSLRRMTGYLGLVPRCHDPGGKSRSGHHQGIAQAQPDDPRAVDLSDYQRNGLTPIR